MLVFRFGKSLVPTYFCVKAECIGSEVRTTVACKTLVAMPMKHSSILIFFILVLCDFNLVFGQITKSKTYISHYKDGNYIYKKEAFDRNGNLISEIDCFDEKCISKDVEIHKYDTLNQLIEDSVYTTQWGYFQLIWNKVYTYYDNGKLRTETKINNNCIENYDEQLIYYYDNTKKLMRILTKHACEDKNYFNYPIYFLYDSTGKIISKTAMNRDTNKVFYKYIYIYDRQNNLIRDDYYFSDRDSVTLSSSRFSEYNQYGELISYKWVSSFGTYDSTSYSYYKNGLLKEEKNFPNPKKQYWTQNYYNKKKELTTMQTFFIDNDKKVKKGIKKTIIYTYY